MYWKANGWGFIEERSTSVVIGIVNPGTLTPSLKHTHSNEQQPRYIGIIEGKNDHTVIVTLPKHYEIELKYPNLNTFTSLLQRDGEIELNHRQHADMFSSFFKRAPKIYSVHLSLLKGKSFLNHQEEQLLCTFAL